MLAARGSDIPAEACSFRDPAGYVFRQGDRILRAVNARGAPGLDAFLATSLARDAMDNGSLVRTVRIPVAEFPDLSPETVCVLEHERIPFASFPYEWPPEMLHAAGALTLDLAKRALAEGLGLKDATPYNVLFRGSQPVFVDLLSFEPRHPLDQTWLPYAQFARTFLLPLAAVREFGLTLDRSLAGNRDGLEPETVYRWSNWRQRLTGPLRGLVSIPRWLSGRASQSSYRPRPARTEDQARFVLERVLASCERQLDAVAPRAAVESTWSGYLDHKSLYTPEQLAEKEAFVSEALDLARPRTVLDVGANEGRFSFLAARSAPGVSVVAIDCDPAVVGTIWRGASREGLEVLPLVVDLTRPTPALGWRNRECASFLERGLQRAGGGFDLVLMLAVAHHMLVTERVPLDELLDLAAELGREYVLIEFVAPEDPMFQRIVRGRGELYSHLTNDNFEAAAARRFERVRSRKIQGLHRWLHLLRRRA